ncbi:trypsin-like serine peptidase [Crenobacter caeni]|uniref:Trypsin-like serine protease n=1 Tax=Crenobacter caeni TaxID=2705474 RepID=A0A6B2KWC6_9NEIS|nr:trypsin-like serine protease [Crenobacter caeni]NDV14359.1 trypsin-like serine protease [Crenobacter caeni]
MSKLHPGWLLPALLAAMPAVAGNPLLFGHDDRVAVVPERMPWQAIGQLESRSGQLCTGTLIAPDIVLSAGHCLIDEHGRFDPAVAFRLAQHGDTQAALGVPGRAFVDRRLMDGLSPARGGGVAISPEAAPYDIALVRLRAPIAPPAATLPLFAGDARALRQALRETGWHVSQAGYPEDDSVHLKAHLDCKVSALQGSVRLTHRCDTLGGDSGSPLLLEVAGAPVVIAVQSSAPDAADRARADNVAVPVLRLGGALAWLRATDKETAP